MASIFTYDPDPPRVSSPWSTSGSSTPGQANQANQANQISRSGLAIRTQSTSGVDRAPDFLSDYGITKLEPEPQEGPTEYKLHLLLRPRRPYLSMSTGNVVAGSYHSRVPLTPASCSASPAQDATPRPMQAKSAQSRQQRLQGLTTQLLWRLQQSSPFHSSTTANLVVPVLPYATPQSGVPSKPARLLPGLEESQGALYEIGVADDGTFVGLTEDELDESVTTLQTMAASLGCKVEILRRVIVGKCEWAEDSLVVPPDPSKCQRESLWVAEALVSPDLDFYKLSSASVRKTTDVAHKGDARVEGAAEADSSNTEQVRISITGPSASGKSSLLGTLTSSSLDNGRGSSRLSLLKHRHEISSGITSSVAQELIGYAGDVPPTVVNYASGNVAAWDDIHAASRGGRLAFISDLPGSVRYLKSTLRGLVSWAPHYVMLCIPANCGDETADAESGAESAGEIDRCLAYLDLCLKLEVNIVIVITKLDVASRGGLRENLAKVLSALKSSGRKPAMLPASPAGDRVLNLQQVTASDSNEVQKSITAAEGDWPRTVPIVLSSAVDGTGIGKLHAFLRHLPIPARPPQRRLRIPRSIRHAQSPADFFDVDEVFAIPPSKVYSASADKEGRESRGMVLCGLVRHGSISIGDEMTIGPILVDTSADSGSDPAAPLSLLSRSIGHGQSGASPASLSHGVLSGKDASVQAKWQRVRVVSVRDLRLPVRCLKEDQVGTIGIELLASLDEGPLPRLSRIRKGMVLIDLHTSLHLGNLLPSPLPSILPLPFHTGFTATFPAAEFSAPNSPPLLLGGNAIAYIANVRTTVRVVCMALAGPGDEPASRSPSPSQSPTEPEFFSFDGDTQSSPSPRKDKDSNGSHANGMDWSMRRRPSATDIRKVVSGTSGNGPDAPESFKEDVMITFGLVASVEWIELGSQVLIMPSMSMTASSGVAVAPAPESGTGNGNGNGVVSTSGLEGFVGTICEVVPGRSVGCEF
ncbi:GTP-binding protein 2 [Penicillium rolfsii]|nr:GTP-binding protein 2 [Penicillium rolfsii]